MVEKITDLFAEEIKDSRGVPTLEVFASCGDITVSAKVPSGTSAGTHEAKELRDADGKGVIRAIRIISEEIAPKIINQSVNRKQIDQILLDLDGTEDKSRLGGNSMIGVSIAVEYLESAIKQIPLWKKISEDNSIETNIPVLYMNIINGGRHANFRLPFQEYMVILKGNSPSQMYNTGKLLFTRLGKVIEDSFGIVPLGHEGGFSPECETIEEPFEILTKLINGVDNSEIGIDSAASEFFNEGVYTMLGKEHSSSEMMDLYKQLIKDYPLKSIEDPFMEDDSEHFSALTDLISSNVLIVADDLTVTNPKRLSWAVKEKLANGIIIKPNQVGTLTEMFETIKIARESGWKMIVSHRSGDTNSSFISDLAVGIGAYGIKAGSPNPPERRAKYERLIEIEKELEN